ncbi:unnamed protein product [Paramecium sonneborni]|uniref:CRC domain-containing protein n=1 Tax=Paramecium sonneborni TaxID=65129 RepID=A0A8S1LH97_9CILI|nr:unnamed protein product [Paramecium sonneborni]
MSNEKWQFKQSSFRQSNSPQNHMLMDSPRLLQAINNYQFQDFIKSPQILSDIYSQENNQPFLSRQISYLDQFDQESFILKSSRTLSQENEKHDQTHDQKLSNQIIQCQNNQNCQQHVDKQLECVNRLQKQKTQETQAFKFQKKNSNKFSENTQQPCNCKNSGCLKRYCRCFHSGRLCLPECQCSEECQNNQFNIQERSKAIEYVNQKCYRNRKIPRDTLFKLDVIYGCSCTKSKCRKRYCECFLRNLNCTQNCKCFDCCNHSNFNTSH